MATKTLNWCTECKLDCGSSLPTTAWLCVSNLIVTPPVTTTFGFVVATLTGVRASTCADACRLGKWVYTISYDDTQLVDGFTLQQPDILNVICSDCLTDFIQNQTATPADTLCADYVNTYDEFIAGIAAGADIILCSPIVLEDDVEVVESLVINKGASIDTNGFTLTLTGMFSSPPFQCFISALGEVVFSSGTTCDNLYFEWFGALGDGVSDDTSALQKTISAARVNAGGVGNIPIQALVAKTYMMSALTIPAFCVIRGSPIEKSASIFRCNTASATMFSLNGDSGFAQDIRFDGLRLDGNDLADTIIYVKNAGLFECVDCQFYGGVAAGVTNMVHLDEYAIWNWFRNCEFDGNYTYGLHVSGEAANQNTAEDCHFTGSNCTYAVYTDDTWQGDTLLLEDCAMEAGGCQDMIYLDHYNIAGNPNSVGNKVSIVRCRFDRTVTRAHINVIRYTWGVFISDCRMVDPCQFNVLTDARSTTVRDCFLGNSTIACVRMTVNSYRCHIGPNVRAGSALFIEDQGGTHENWIFRKTLVDTTANRPADMQPCEQGYLYMDTTLDADGLPIFWNGVIWIKADGSAA